MKAESDTQAADSLGAQLAAAAQDAAGARPVDAVKTIAALLAANPSDPRPYRAAFEALSAAARQPKAMNKWDGPEKSSFYKQLLLQPDCPDRPLIFHHGVASLVTSQNLETVAVVTNEVKPVLRELLEKDVWPPALILFMLVVRGVLNDLLPASDLSSAHIKVFPSFQPGDLALPYSVVFNEGSFGENRDDLLRQYSDPTMAFDPKAGLRPSHLLLLEWLGASGIFSDTDNADLLSVLRQMLTSAKSTKPERAAARSLILRHWRRGSVITNDAAKELGLSDNVIDVAKTLDPLPGKGTPTQATHRLESRPWQAARLVQALAGPALPFLRGRRKMRVAICVSGQLRGFETALKTWKHTLLNAADCDIFVHTWAAIGQASAQPFRAVLPFAGEAFCAEWRRIGTLAGYDALQARYPAIFLALDAGGRIQAPELQSHYMARTAIVDDESDPRFAAFSNQDKMHYKISAAHDLAMASGQEYDLFVRIRPDLSLRYRGFGWRDMVNACTAEPVLYCDCAFGVHFGQPMIGDQLAIGAPHTMARYAATWTSHSALAAVGVAGAPDQLTGHVSLAQTCWVNGIRAARVPIKLGTLHAPQPLSSWDIAAALEIDTVGRKDAFDADFLAAVQKDLGKNT